MSGMAVAASGAIHHWRCFSRGQPARPPGVSIPLGVASCQAGTSPPRRQRSLRLQLPGTSFAEQHVSANPRLSAAVADALLKAETVGSNSSECAAREFSPSATVKIVGVVGEGRASPFDGVAWEDVMRHMAQRLNWISPTIDLLIFREGELTQRQCPNDAKDESSGTGTESEALARALAEADILLAIEIESAPSVRVLTSLMGRVTTSVCLGTNAELSLENRLGGLAIGQLSFAERAAASLGVWPEAAESFKVMHMVMEAWERCQPDDIWFAILLLVNAYVEEVPTLQNLRAQDLTSLQCMLSNCGSQIAACLVDPDCRNAISCLNACGPTDQVCSYRCIVSYESPQFEAFSLCVLQKHNCLRLNAEIRMRPDVPPMTSFRGEPLTHSLAEDLFVGWLGKEEYSWRVVAGQNAAYDQFPCQYQIFYRGKARSTMWYDPVFTVLTLDGRAVWRRRHYRVRRAEQPGTFWFSVLDNGVISKELWRIVHVEDDFSWALFYYSGAAAAAGQSYTGAVLLSPDGRWPPEPQQRAVEAALERCGIKVWELYRVDNERREGAPLGLPDDVPAPASIV